MRKCVCFVIVLVVLSICMFGCSSINKKETSANIENYLGEWICKEKNTSINLSLDNFGHIEGNIVTVVGERVPSSTFVGEFSDERLEVDLIEGDGDVKWVIGKMILTLKEDDIIEGFVEIDESKAPYLELAEGEMTFVKP